MAKGFLNINTSKSGNTSYYSRSKECIFSYIFNHQKASEFYSITYKDNKNKTAQLFKRIERFEMAKRKGSRVKTTMIMALPNDITKQDFRIFAEKMSNIFFKNVPVAMFLHEGKKGEVQENKHCHIVFSERDLTTGKKDRKYSERGFVDIVRKEYQKHFNFTQQEEETRKRVSTYLWKSDADFVRQQIKLSRQTKEVEEEEIIPAKTEPSTQDTQEKIEQCRREIQELIRLHNDLLTDEYKAEIKAEILKYRKEYNALILKLQREEQREQQEDEEEDLFVRKKPPRKGFRM